MSSLDSEAAFTDRAEKIGIEKWIVDKFRAKKFATFGKLAFAFPYAPQSTDDGPLRTFINNLVEDEPGPDQMSALRRLFFEAHTMALTDVRHRAEVNPDPSQAVRKLATAERVARQKAQQVRLGGLVFNPNTIPSNHLVDLYVEMVESGILSYIKAEHCCSRAQEVEAVKRDPTVFSKADGAPAFYIANSLMFGATAAVYSFNRISRSLWFLLNRMLVIPCGVFYDDYPLFSPAEVANNADESASELLDLLGWRHARTGPKGKPFEEKFQVLGCGVDSSYGHALVGPRVTRVAMDGNALPGGFRARWRSRAHAEGSEELFTPIEGPGSEGRVLSEADKDDWEEVEKDQCCNRSSGPRVTFQEVESYWSALPPALKELVSENGEVQPDLLTFLVYDDGQRTELLRSLGCPEEALKEKALVLEALQLISTENSNRLRRNKVAKRGAARLLLEGEEPTKRWLEQESGAVAIPRRRRRADDPNIPEGSADEIRLREKHRWQKEADKIVAVLEENIDLPIVLGAEESVHPEEYLTSVIGAFRSSTLRKRSAEWAKYVRWLETIHRVRWPSRAVHAVDYLTELRIAGAPPSVPQAFASTLGFFERAAGVRTGQRISEDPAFRRALDHTNKEAEEGKPEKRQAPILPLKVKVAMELLVMNPSVESFIRFSAWTKLVKLWTASRTDDLQGMSLKTLRFTKAGLHGIFWKTKVSGPGKKNKILPFMVNAKVSLTGLPWLKAGMDLLEEKYWYPRDYLVPTYPESMEDLERRRPASYEDFVLTTRLVYSRLKEAQFDGSRWIGGRSPLVLPDLYRLWTEHSERNWLITMAASTGIHREERQALGRWAVKESSDEYIRAAQRIVSKIQAEVLVRLRNDRDWELRHAGLDSVEEGILKGIKDAETMNLHFIIPLTTSASSSAGSSTKATPKTANQPAANPKGNAKGRGKGGKATKKLHVKSADGKAICFRYNNGNKCPGGCGFVHICQRCLGPHPKSQCGAVTTRQRPNRPKGPTTETGR
eukprot:s1782_g21.t1